MRTTVTLTGCCLALCTIAAAQAPAPTSPPAPVRPRLAADADTNDPLAYYLFGLRQIGSDPAASIAAFYWASRLNPEEADFLYARAAALVVNDPQIYFASRRGDSPRAVQARSADSLVIRAYILNPFARNRLQEQMLVEAFAHAQGLSIHAGADASYIEREIQRLMRNDPDIGALINVSRGRYDDAINLWARYERQNPKNPYIRASRARALYLRGDVDSARAQMAEALTVARQRDADSTRFIYESKAAWEYSLGRMLEQLGNVQAARDAYEQTIVEDLSYYPAHIRLGVLLIGQHDTAGAMREFARAVEAREDEYLPRATYGFYLASAGRYDSAAVHLRRAVELEPWSANSQITLASVLEAAGRGAAAVPYYERYVALAKRGDPDVVTARGRIVALRGR